MDELKKPTSLLAGTNIIFSVGSFMYFYKRMEQLQADNIELRKNIASLTEKVTKNSTIDIQTEEELKDITKDVKKVKGDYSKLEDNMKIELKAITKALETNNISVTIPKKKKKKSKYESSEESSSSYEEKKKSYKKKHKEELEDEDLIRLVRKGS